MTFPHRPPTNKPGLRLFLWRQRVWFEASLGLAMMDTWEIIIIYSILLVVLSLLSFAILFYLPVHVGFLSRRAAYYIKGDESRSILDKQDFSNLARYIGMLGSTSKDGSAVQGMGKVDL